MTQGILLFAHGARDPRWALPFEEVMKRVQRQQPDAAVALAFLEFMSPTLADAGQTLAEQGCKEVMVVPLFLGAGGHVRKDLPLLMDQLRGQHAAVQWSLKAAIGEMDSVIDAMALAVSHEAMKDSAAKSKPSP